MNPKALFSEIKTFFKTTKFLENMEERKRDYRFQTFFLQPFQRFSFSFSSGIVPAEHCLVIRLSFHPRSSLQSENFLPNFSSFSVTLERILAIVVRDGKHYQQEESPQL